VLLSSVRVWTHAAALAQVSSYAASDLFYLPPGTIPRMVMPFDPTASVPLALVTVSSPMFNETTPYDVAYFELRNRLQGISGVIGPAVYGGTLRRILAYVDRNKLEACGLSPMDVVPTPRTFSTLILTGDAKLGDLDYQIITDGVPARVSDMNDFPVMIDPRGAPVFVCDVGAVEDTHQIQSNVVRISAPPDMTAKRQVYRSARGELFPIVDAGQLTIQLHAPAAPGSSARRRWWPGSGTRSSGSSPQPTWPW
jgi:multidrug efflux pump subunit AcrB